MPLLRLCAQRKCSAVDGIDAFGRWLAGLKGYTAGHKANGPLSATPPYNATPPFCSAAQGAAVHECEREGASRGAAYAGEAAGSAAAGTPTTLRVGSLYTAPYIDRLPRQLAQKVWLPLLSSRSHGSCCDGSFIHLVVQRRWSRRLRRRLAGASEAQPGSCRTAQSHRARPEEAQQPGWGTTNGGTLTILLRHVVPCCCPPARSASLHMSKSRRAVGPQQLVQNDAELASPAPESASGFSRARALGAIHCPAISHPHTCKPLPLQRCQRQTPRRHCTAAHAPAPLSVSPLSVSFLHRHE